VVAFTDNLGGWFSTHGRRCRVVGLGHWLWVNTNTGIGGNRKVLYFSFMNPTIVHAAKTQSAHARACLYSTLLQTYTSLLSLWLEKPTFINY